MSDHYVAEVKYNNKVYRADDARVKPQSCFMDADSPDCIAYYALYVRRGKQETDSSEDHDSWELSDTGAASRERCPLQDPATADHKEPLKDELETANDDASTVDDEMMDESSRKLAASKKILASVQALTIQNSKKRCKKSLGKSTSLQPLDSLKDKLEMVNDDASTVDDKMMDESSRKLAASRKILASAQALTIQNSKRRLGKSTSLHSSGVLLDSEPTSPPSGSNTTMSSQLIATKPLTTKKRIKRTILFDIEGDISDERDFLRLSKLYPYKGHTDAILCCYSKSIQKLEIESIVNNLNQRSIVAQCSLLPNSTYVTLLQRYIQLSSTIGSKESRLLRRTFERPEADYNLVMVKTGAYGGELVTIGSVRSLRRGIWLNDEVVQFVLINLKKEADQQGRKCLMMSTHFYTKLCNIGDKSARLNGVYNFNNFRSLFLRRKRLQDLLRMDKVLFPINVGYMHWILVVAYIPERRIRIMDTYHEDYVKEMEDIHRFLVDYEMRLHGEKSVWTLVYDQSDVPIQYNGSDCGACVCLTAESIVKGWPLYQYSEQQVNRFRELTAIQILQWGNAGSS